MTRGPVEAGSTGTVVDVLTAVRTGPPVDADAGETSDGVGARRSVLAHFGPHQTLVNVVRAVEAGERSRALTRVVVDAVHARGSVLAQVSRTVVDVLLACLSAEACRAFALVVERVQGLTCASVQTGRRLTWDVLALAVLASESFVAYAFVGAVGVDALSVDAGLVSALVDVAGACWSGEPFRTAASEAFLQRRALCSVAARLGRTVVHQFTVVSSVASSTRAGVVVEAAQITGPSVLARVGVTGVGHRYLAQTGRVPDGACAGESRSSGHRHQNVACPTVLTSGTRTRVARIQVLAILSDMHGRAVAVGFSPRV